MLSGAGTGNINIFKKVIKWFCYYIISYYVSTSIKFDAVFHHIIASIRSREVTFFGLWKKFDMNTTICIRSLRCKLLKVLRRTVQSHVHMSKNLCRDDNCGNLLCEMFSSEMSQLALGDYICDEFLQLSSIKELWQLFYLLRSEYLRIFFLQLSRPSKMLIFVFFDLFRETMLLRSSKIRLSSALEFISYRESHVTERKMQKFPASSSIDEKIRAHLSFASEILNGSELSDEKRYLHVAEILKEAIELVTPKKHVKYEDKNETNVSSSLSISESEDETEITMDDLPVEKIYEGSPVVTDDEQNVVFSSWEEDKSNDATARSMVMELKARLVERSRKMDKDDEKASSEEIQKIAIVKDEFQKILTESEDCNRIEQHDDAEGEIANRMDRNIFTALLDNDKFRSSVGMNLKEALSFRQTASCVDFIDDPADE